PPLAVAVLGFIDDVRPLPWAPRLAIHFLAAAAAGLLMFPELGWLGAVAAVLWVAAMTHPFNMLSHMDALCGGTAWIAAAALAAIGLVGEEFGDVAHALILMGALTGFLWFNRPPARVFLGDAGSTFVGFTVGLLSLRAALNQPEAWSWLVVLALLAVPVYDMTAVLLLRLSQGRNPFHADTQHLSHRLVRRGWSRPMAVGIIHLLALASGTAALLLVVLPSAEAVSAVAIIFTA